MKRRTLLLGGAAGALALGAALRPSEEGENHAPYFLRLSEALDMQGLSQPTLVVDKQKVLANVETLRRHLQPQLAYRVVAKSLPSIPLLELVMNAAQTNRLMLFHQPFVNQVATAIPTADVLMGKPMPVASARRFYADFAGGAFDPAKQLKWLVDSPQRMAQYAALADALRQPMRIAIELDVGLHRGGVQTDEELLAMLQSIDASPWLSFAGFMGYEPHVVKIPFGDVMEYRDAAMAQYAHDVALAQATLGDQWPSDVVLNAGGSPTYQLYDKGDFPFNELATGSCLVKPTDFDIPTLADHQPASYVATPVLKVQDKMQLPGVDIGGLQSMWNPNRAQTFFTYGGYWKATPESPSGLSHNDLFGRSTNQEMLNGSRRISLQADDWIFLRPNQSEFVFLQFGDIAVLDQGRIVDQWPVFSQGSSSA